MNGSDSMVVTIGSPKSFGFLYGFIRVTVLDNLSVALEVMGHGDNYPVTKAIHFKNDGSINCAIDQMRIHLRSIYTSTRTFSMVMSSDPFSNRVERIYETTSGD